VALALLSALAAQELLTLREQMGKPVAGSKVTRHSGEAALTETHAQAARNGCVATPCVGGGADNKPRVARRNEA
jgi:hypothetical protein